MKKFMFELGPDNGQAEVLLSDENGLVIHVTEDNEEYTLSFGDGIFINRRFHDDNAYQHDISNDFCKAFTENVILNLKDILHIPSCSEHCRISKITEKKIL